MAGDPSLAESVQETAGLPGAVATGRVVAADGAWELGLPEFRVTLDVAATGLLRRRSLAT